jgi:primase-polymerase (primpol)-like protein
MNIIPENIPQELRDMQRWIVWLLVPNPDPKKKPIKEPHSPFTGIKCDPTVASSASDFATALEAYSRMMMSGIGFVTIKEDNLVFLDFDHCVDENGTWNEATKLFFSHRPTYCEMSPSGTGLRAVYHGVLPPLPNDKTCVNNQLTGLEMYEQKHYLTFTGNKIENAPDFVAEDDGIIAELYDKFGKLTAKEKKKRASKKKAHRTEPLSDYELLVRIREASGADDFDKLWNGELDPKKYGSQSDADFALCCKLAFWTGRDAEQMDRLFRQSKLYREKWDVSHSSDGSTYGAMSIAKACDSVTDIYAPDAAIFESKGVLFRRKGDNVYPLTNFVVVPIEMIVAEDETQMTAELVTSSGETHNLVFMTSDFANMQKFKNVLNKKTIALAYYGADGDLEVLKGYISELEWNV